MLGGISDVSKGIANAFKHAGAELIIVHHVLHQEDVRGELPTENLIEVNLEDPPAIAAKISTLSFQTAVICPGWFSHMPFMLSDPTDIDEAFSFNFEQATFAAQAAAKQLIVQGQGGSIIFISSVAGLTPMVHTNLAGSSLAAIEVIAKMAAVDLAPHNIRVNTVAAGWTKGDWSTPLLNPAGEMHEPSDIPAGQAGSALAVGHTCCFLTSPYAAYITGVVLPVDGGFLLTKSAAMSPYA